MHFDIIETVRLTDVSASDHPLLQNESVRKVTIQISDEFGVGAMVYTVYIDEPVSSIEDLEHIAVKQLGEVCGRIASEVNLRLESRS